MKPIDLIGFSRPAGNSVLIVEDDNEAAPLLDFLLQRAGYDVVRAADGRQAERLIAQLRPPRLALLETQLPYRSGFELLRKIRAEAAWDGVQVIMLTSNAGQADAHRAHEEGADECMVKPVRPEAILQRLAFVEQATAEMRRVLAIA